MTATPSLRIRGLARRFGAVAAVDDFDLDVPAGAFVVLVGPSGCGKTTVLRLLAGLEEASSGAIVAGDRDLAGVAPVDRGMGMVFQSYALFPNLTVAENIGFGLARGLSRAQRESRVGEMLEVVGLAGLGRRRPGQLSGGQQQRVAMARALAPSPATLLLDEPLSALDPHNRERLRLELKRLQRRLGVTTLMVTHDQAEAMALADVIVVMRQGRIEQVGAPEDVYSRPATPFVASFLGAMNFWPATVGGPREVALDGGGGRLAVDASRFSRGESVILAVRPERVSLGEPRQSDPDVLVEAVEFRGASARVAGRMTGGAEVIADIPAHASNGLVGTIVSIGVASGAALVFPADGPR